MKRILFTVFVTFFLITPNYAQNKRFLQAITGGHNILLGNPTDATAAYNLFDSLATVADSILSELVNRGINPYNYAGLNAAYTQATDDSNFLFVPPMYSADSSVAHVYGQASILDFRSRKLSIKGGFDIQGKEYWMAVGDTLSNLNTYINNYDVINIPAGTYTSTDDTTWSIHSKKKIKLRGAGKGKTIISAASGASLALRLVNCDSMIIEGISFRGGNWGTVHFDTTKAIIFRDCEVSDGMGMGIRRSDNIKIISSDFHDNTGTNSAHGLEFFETTSSLAANNYSFNNQGMGIEIWDSQYVTLQGNVTGGNKAGINVNGYLGPSPPAGVGSRFCSISGNTSVDDTIGVKLGGYSSWNTFTANTINNIDITGNGVSFSDTEADSNFFVGNIINSTNIWAGAKGTNSILHWDEYKLANSDGIYDGNLFLSPNPTVPAFYTGVIVKNGSTTWSGMNSSGGATNIFAVYTGGGNGTMRFYVGDSTTNILAQRIYGDGGITIGSPTGNSKGNETLNVGGLIYQDGNPLLVPNGITAGAELTYGLNDNFGLNFETNGTQRIQIGNSGDVTFTGGIIIDGTGETKGLGSLKGTVHTQTTSGATANLFQYTTASNRNYYVEATYTATNTVSAEGAIYKRIAGFRNISGTLTQIGATNNTVTLEDDATWDANFNVSGTSIQFRVVGDGTDTCEWQLKYIIETVTR